MSLCTQCGKYLCDHTPEERGQTYEEMMRPLTTEEDQLRITEPPNSPKKIAMARRNAHLTVEGDTSQ